MRNPLSFKGLLAAALLLPGIGASAYDFEYEGLYYNILSESERTVEVTYPETEGRPDYYTELTDVVIPETVTFGSVKYTVTAVGASAFFQSSITSVKIPNTVTRIGGTAFTDSYSLTNIEMSSKVDTIMNGAFCDTKIESIDLGDSLVYIGASAFANCRQLKAIDIPSTVEEINTEIKYLYDGSEVPFEGSAVIYVPIFGGCSSLPEINVDENNKNYASVDGVLYTKDLKTMLSCPTGYEKETVAIPEGTEEINDHAFYYCRSLKYIDIPKNIREVTGKETVPFEGCDSLREINVVEDNQHYASVDGVLYDKDRTTMILCPSNYGHETIAIPEETMYIESYAIYSVKRLTHVDLPKNLGRIFGLGTYDGPFRNCSNLREINVAEGNQHYYSFDGVLYIKNDYEGDSLVVCPSRKENVEILDGIKYIGDYAFDGCNLIESLVIPSSVVEIYDNAIDCYNLTSLEIGSGVTYIGSWAINASNLVTLKCHAVTPPTVEGNRFNFDSDFYTNVTLMVPDGSKELYASTEPWSNFVNIEEMTATGIGGVEAGDVVISADGGTLTVSGLADGCTVEVYTLDGKQVYGGKGGSISGLGSGVYVVKAGGKTVKVVL